MLYSLSNFVGGKAAFSEIVKSPLRAWRSSPRALLDPLVRGFCGRCHWTGIRVGGDGSVRYAAPLVGLDGVEAVDVGNKNAFSLFVLPAVLLCGFLFFEMPVKSRPLPVAMKSICVAAMACVLSIF